jgi:hypothetical protein
MEHKMGWESRKGRGRYYTRSTRVGGQVVREYVGGGAAGELAAREDARRRAQEQGEREAWRTSRAELESVAALVAAADELTETLARAALVSAGCRRHHRGEWRRRRG